MSELTVGIMTPGDMGHRVGAVLRAKGARVVTCLEGRSPRTAQLAEAAGIEAVATDAALVDEADLILSILVPSAAEAMAERIAAALVASESDLVYVDCNAIAPETACRIAERIGAAGGLFVDAGIIGPPPQLESDNTRFYASSPDAGAFAALGDYGLDVRVIGERPGEASAVKMCYAALTKGTTALMTQLALAAARLGVSAPLAEEFMLSQQAMLQRMRGAVPGMIPKAHRWVGEMEEIAKTFAAAGVTPKSFEGAAELYAFVAGTELADTTPERWAVERKSFEETIAALAGAQGRRTGR